MKTKVFYKDIPVKRHVYGTTIALSCTVNGKKLLAYDMDTLSKKIDAALELANA